MYIVENSYLEDEERDGFYIPSIAKRAWAAELSILHELNRICDKYGICYFADWGSLLGAVRHRGFVPWDDDLDICMFREDLEKLQEVVKEELPEGFRLYSFENNDYSWKFIVNLVNTERMNFTPEYLKSHYNFPYMATIDIFVLDNVTDDEEYEEQRRERVKYILNEADLEDSIDVKRKFYERALSIISEKKGVKTENICQMIPWGIYHKSKFPRDYYDKAIKVPFENTFISVPKRYDMLLKHKYGSFWEVRMGTAGHGYPYYNAQKESLGLPDGVDYIPHYKFNSDIIGIQENGSQFVDGLKSRRDIVASIDEFKNSINYHGEFDRETVIFLPFKGEYWDTMRPFYEAECANKNVDVFVVPLPYYYKEYNGVLMDEPQYNLGAYPEELPIHLVEELDLQSMFPDRVYIQNPYDEFNMCMSVPVEYYASNIRNLTRKLIYVPWFETSDFETDNYPQNYNMQYYCTVPGVVLSDEVYVSSENIRDRYIDKLVEFGGDDTRLIWEEKIRVTPYAKEESLADALLIYFSPSTILEYKEKMIEKINKCIDIFRDNSQKLRFIWHINRYELDIIRENDEWVYNKLSNTFSKISDIVNVDFSMNEEQLLRQCKAYYGDGSYLSKAFVVAEKPVMIESLDGM